MTPSGAAQLTESDIMHHVPGYWVARERSSYTVYREGITHSISDSSYPKDSDGLSIAIARCNYLSHRSRK